MKFLLLTVAFILEASAIPIDEWHQYKEEHNKVYTSEEENTRRLQQYMKSKEIVEEHNRNYERGETSFEMGINKFSDWFPEEIDRMLGVEWQDGELKGEEFHLHPEGPVPDSINWVEKGAVTTVKDQKSCNSSYAFSVVGSLEGLMFTINHTITDLSAQELVDCGCGSGCSGGSPSTCFEYVMMRKGIDTDKSYPYEAREAKCRADAGKKGASCRGYVTAHGEDDLKSTVGTVGPVLVYFAAGKDFLNYKSGVYDGKCNKTNNHPMLAVGYDKDKKTRKDYWLVKNSWGTKWGENGYVRVIRGVKKCHIGDDWSYPFH